MEGSESFDRQFAMTAQTLRLEQIERSFKAGRLTIRVLTAPGYPTFSVTTDTSLTVLEEWIFSLYGVQASGKPHFWSTETER